MQSVWSLDMRPRVSTHVGTRPFTGWNGVVGEKEGVWPQSWARESLLPMLPSSGMKSQIA